MEPMNLNFYLTTHVAVNYSHDYRSEVKWLRKSNRVRLFQFVFQLLPHRCNHMSEEWEQIMYYIPMGLALLRSTSSMCVGWE